MPVMSQLITSMEGQKGTESHVFHRANAFLALSRRYDNQSMKLIDVRKSTLLFTKMYSQERELRSVWISQLYK